MEKLTLVATQLKDPLAQPAFGNSLARPPPSAEGRVKAAK